jgi:Transposase DDE domain group 1
MGTRLVVLPQRNDTGFAPLAVLGYCLTHTRFFDPLQEVDMGIKAVQHQPYQKLQDVIVSVLANCSSIRQVDFRIRPDLVLAEAWGRQQFAEQSTLADTLNAFTASSVDQLRHATQVIYQQHGRALHHDFSELLWLDTDLTGLPASPRAEGSQKGYFSGQRNTYGRQLVRVSAPTYRETLLSKVYAGSQSGLATFKSSVKATQDLLGLTREQRRNTVWRTDGGLGTDANINWALSHDYQVVMKGYNGKRATAFARRIASEKWYTLRQDRWVAIVPHAPRYARRTQTLLLRWLNESKQMKYATLVHSLLDHDWQTIPDLFDQRGAMESEIKMDKSGLLMSKRRKKNMAAQEALILLTDLPHNILAWSHDWMFTESRFATYGPLALVNDVLCIPGEVVIKGTQLQMVALRETHPYAFEMTSCLAKLLDFFGNP